MAADARAFPVPEGLAGERLDVGLSRLLGFSRSKSADLVDAGLVTLDGQSVGRSTRLLPGALLEVRFPDPTPQPASAPELVEGMRVLLDDADVVAVDKPVGVAAHPSPGWTGPTVVGGLAAAGYRVATSGSAERQGVVHRLDVGTSGVMLVAKSEAAYRSLKHQFKARTVDKRYHAVVQGHPDPVRGTVDGPIGRHPVHDHRWAVVAGGKPSVTHYETIEAFPAATLLDVRLETGRTHQIRVHMAALRHPCVGDLTYGADPVLADRLGLTRQWLHAVGLTFQHPATGQPVQVRSPYPADLAHALDVLRAW